MALALRLEQLLATGVVKDFRTLARLGHVSPARISQIMSLLHLARRRSLLKHLVGFRIKFSGCEADAKNLQHRG